MLQGLFLLLIAVLIQSSFAANDEYDYLFKYGYLDKGAKLSQLSPEAIVTALKKAQKFGNIPQTGQMDELTLNYFKKPRCAFIDFHNTEFGSKWKDKTFHPYCMYRGGKQISNSDVLHEIQRAFDEWALYSQHHFYHRQSNDVCDITIDFISRDDYSYPFQGEQVATASYPPNANIQLNNEMNFSIYKSNESNVIELYPVLLHLTGHAMGLKHSFAKGSIMNPVIGEYHYLGTDDISKIQQLYGYYA